MESLTEKLAGMCFTKRVMSLHGLTNIGNNRAQANQKGAVIEMQDKMEIKLRTMIGHLNAAQRQAKDLYRDLYQSEFSGPWDVDEYLDSLGPDCTKTSDHDSSSNNDDSERSNYNDPT